MNTTLTISPRWTRAVTKALNKPSRRVLNLVSTQVPNLSRFPYIRIKNLIYSITDIFYNLLSLERILIL